MLNIFGTCLGIFKDITITFAYIPCTIRKIYLLMRFHVILCSRTFNTVLEEFFLEEL